LYSCWRAVPTINEGNARLLEIARHSPPASYFLVPPRLLSPTEILALSTSRVDLAAHRGGNRSHNCGTIPIYRLAARYLSLVHRAMSYLSAVFLAGCAGLWAFARHAAVRRAWVKRSHGYRYFSVGAQPVFAGLQRPLVSEFIQKLIDENSLVGSRLMKLWRVGQLPMRNPRMQAVDTESKITATRPFRPIIWKMNGGSLMLSEIAHPPNSYPG
jgi:hypothetical protein